MCWILFVWFSRCTYSPVVKYVYCGNVQFELHFILFFESGPVQNFPAALDWGGRAAPSMWRGTQPGVEGLHVSSAQKHVSPVTDGGIMSTAEIHPAFRT